MRATSKSPIAVLRTALAIGAAALRPYSRRSGEVLFTSILRRYETRSTMMPNNRPLEDQASCSAMCRAPRPFWTASGIRRRW